MIEVDKKIVVSGNLVEVYDYARGIWIDENSSYVSISKSKAISLKRLIYCNLYRWRAENGKALMPLFLTLTFKEDITADLARQQCKLFFRRFAQWRKKFDGQTNKYVWVMEFTKRGRPHFHVLVFNLPFVTNGFDILTSLWDNGHILFKAVNKGFSSKMAQYMAKYMSKSKKPEGLELEKSRSYVSSRGLLRPVIFQKPEIINDFLKSMIGEDFYLQSEYSYPSLSSGQVYVRQYVFTNMDFDALKSVHYYVDETYPSLS